LSDVDAHDLLEQRVPTAVGEHLALQAVDRILSAQHHHEEEGGIADRDPGNELLDGQPEPPGHPPHRSARPVDELVEHEGVLGLLDDLVEDVAELFASVAQVERPVEEALLEEVLEVPPGLQAGRHSDEAESGLVVGRLRPVPLAGGEGIDVGQDPAGVGRIDDRVRRVGLGPVDVAVGVEALAGGQAAEPTDHGGEGAFGIDGRTADGAADRAGHANLLLT